jgi:co-chaperonin GroES (HSP10)
MKNFEMKNEFIACELEKRVEAKTESGLYLPAELDKKTQVYRIIGVPKACDEYKVGDRVLLDTNTYTEIKANVDGEDLEFTYITAEHILCVLMAAKASA